MNPVQQRAEVVGLASTVDIDDGTDFELSTALIHASPLQSSASSALPTPVHQALPLLAKTNESVRGASSAPLTACASPLQSTPSSALTPTTATSTMTYSHHQCCNVSQYSAAVVQCVAPASVLSQIAKPVATGKLAWECRGDCGACGIFKRMEGIKGLVTNSVNCITLAYVRWVWKGELPHRTPDDCTE
ncbi:unnamed protein product [Hydatigera taeniaeformis]|uniref:Uncharacterized protein n=1 Tax=Hydatigena taeniaeformis TaxID=6205 RepID=A0A3P7GTI6_HYDTA|nr:unnamed protein product [Hydatigera taeniaeformis]